MANTKTQKVKNEVLRLLKNGPLSLYKLCCSVPAATELLIGAIQSLWTKGEIVFEEVEGNELPVGDGVIVKLNDAGNAGKEKSEAEVNEQFIASTVSACAARLRREVRDNIKSVLSDGRPRSKEELEEYVSFYGINPESEPDIIVLQDGRYTLRTVEAGKNELKRREEEAAERAEKVKHQKSIVDNLLKEKDVITGEQLEEALGEPLMFEVAQKLVHLSDGSYTKPDSSVAWEDIASYLAQREPMGSKEFSRMFKSHKKLISSLRKGEEITPFVVLPDDRITVEYHPAGQKEMHRRYSIYEVQQKLDELIKEHAFFSIYNNFAKNQRKLAVEEAMERGCTWIKYEGKTLWCSPLKYHPRKMAGELASFTGLSFSGEGKSITPYKYILDNTLKPAEAARKLEVKPGQVISLYKSGYLPGVNMDGSLRIWKKSLSALQPGNSLDKMVKRTEEVALPEVSRILGIPRRMVRQLMREGYLEPVENQNKGRKAELVFRRGEVEDLLGVVSGLKEKWEVDRARRLKGEEKRKPRREKESPRVEQGPITLDRFQREAIEKLDQGASVLVAAPTGTGKTVIAEKIVEKVLGENKEIIYTSPIKALSNQKFRDFSNLFGREKVGLITGDLSINERSPLLVMTTEIFRNWCFSNPEWMSNISFVIFDEVHYLDDPHRGTAWEESIIFAPPHIKILGLSATVPNIHELARWMSDVRQYPVEVVEEYERAVPLVIKYVTADGEVLSEREAREEIELYVESERKGYKKNTASFR